MSQYLKGWRLFMMPEEIESNTTNANSEQFFTIQTPLKNPTKIFPGRRGDKPDKKRGDILNQIVCAN
jgi:hypothetical protein